MSDRGEASLVVCLGGAAITAMPVVIAATTFDGFVEGWELDVSTDQYAVNLDLSPVI
jgi:pheromone shutdown protein TraB